MGSNSIAKEKRISVDANLVPLLIPQINSRQSIHHRKKGGVERLFFKREFVAHLATLK